MVSRACTHAVQNSATNDFVIVHEVRDNLRLLAGCWVLAFVCQFRSSFGRAVIADCAAFSWNRLYRIYRIYLTMDQEKKSDIVVSVRPVFFRMSSKDSTSTQMKKFRDNSDDETDSQVSRASSLEEAEAGTSKPKWYWHSRSRSLQSWFSVPCPAKSTRRRRCCYWSMIVLVVLGFFGVIAGM